MGPSLARWVHLSDMGAVLTLVRRVVQTLQATSTWIHAHALKRQELYGHPPTLPLTSLL
jgi:hypothetical protein